MGLEPMLPDRQSDVLPLNERGSVKFSMTERIMTHPHISAIIKALNSLTFEERKKVYIFINEKDFGLVRKFGQHLIELITDVNIMRKLGIYGTIFGSDLKIRREVRPGFFYLIESEEFEMIHAIGREFSFKDY